MHKVKSRHVLIEFYRPEKCPVKQKNKKWEKSRHGKEDLEVLHKMHPFNELIRYFYRYNQEKYFITILCFNKLDRTILSLVKFQQQCPYINMNFIYKNQNSIIRKLTEVGNSWSIFVILNPLEEVGCFVHS